MEDNIKKMIKNGRRPQKTKKMEADLQKIKMEADIKKDKKWKTTSDTM
jgi:hypothetical protein